MNWPAIITLVAALAAFITALASICTVREMKKQRQQSIKPHLIILNPVNKYELRWFPLHDAEVKVHPILPNGHEIAYERPIFRLKNIGYGPAKIITLEWKIRGDQIDTIVMNSALLSNFRTRIETGIIYIVQRGTSEILIPFPISDTFTLTLPYCIASPGTDFVDNITIPSQIMTSIAFRIIAKQPEIFSTINGPCIDLTLSYEDFENKTKKTSLVIKSFFRRFFDNDSTNNITGELIFSVIE